LQIKVELFGQLLPQMPRRQVVDCKPDAKVMDIAHELKIKPDEIGLITINGVQSEFEDDVLEECRLCFFPYVSGG